MIVPADLLTPHGARELAQLAAPAGTLLDPALLEATLTGADRDAWSLDEQALADQAAALLQSAVDTANAQIGRVASGRTLSLDEQAVLSAHARDLARYRLYDDGALPELHPVLLRYREAMRFLERVADGREPLGQATAGTAGLPQTSAPARTFDADSLAAYR